MRAYHISPLHLVKQPLAKYRLRSLILRITIFSFQKINAHVICEYSLIYLQKHEATRENTRWDERFLQAKKITIL